MAPSKGYKRLNDNTPTELGSLNQKLEEAMKKSGLKPSPLPQMLPSRRKGGEEREGSVLL